MITIISNHVPILGLQIHTNICYFHPVIHLHANNPIHFHNCCESNIVVLTMMMSLRSQIKSRITFLLANTPSILLKQPTKIFTQFTERIFLCHLLSGFAGSYSFNLPFHPSIYPLRRIILKHYKTLLRDQDTKDIFKLLPITSYKRESNICRNLVRASEPQSLMFSDAGTFSCKRRRCNTCKFVTNCSAMRIKGPKGSFNATQPITCIHKDIVYGIICKRCNIIYNGETGRRLADRITEHIRSIRNFFSVFPVAQHFIPPSHFSLNDFSVTGTIHCNSSNESRVNIENRIIFKLRTISPLGRNTKFDALSQTCILLT